MASVTFKLPPEPSLLSMVESDAEDAFIVLFKDEKTNTIREEEICNPIENDVKELSNEESDGSCGEKVSPLIAEISSGKFQEKLLQIMEENTLLKERLIENNKIMKSQCKKNSAWKEYQFQAEKDKNLLETLKKENCALNVMLDELKASKDSQDLEIEVLKQIVTDLTESDEEHVKNLEISNQQIEKLKEENDKLNTEIDQLKTDKRIQDEKLASLKQSLTELTQTNTNNVEELEATKKELEEVKTELTTTKSANEEKQKHLDKEIENLRSELVVANEKPTLDQLVQLKEQLDAAKVALMHLEQGKFIGDGQIVKLNAEIFDLTMKLQDSLQQTDQIHALNAQLNVFKADFELEKESKRKLEIENKKLVEELKNLRLCSQQLQEEINAVRDPRITPLFEARAPAITLTSPPSSTEQKMRCPVCDFGFSTQITILDLHSHIDKCLQASKVLCGTY